MILTIFSNIFGRKLDKMAILIEITSFMQKCDLYIVFQESCRFFPKKKVEISENLDYV
jgi:hypothetical protein